MEAPVPLTPVLEEERLPTRADKVASAPTNLAPAPESVPEPASISIPLPEEPELEPQQALSIPAVPFRVIGETMDTYILVEQGESLLLIDKHAAHERVLFEKLKSEEHPVMPQLLLQPVPVQLTKPEAQAVLENLPLLQSLGFDMSEFADLQLVLRQIPSDLTEEDACATSGGLCRGSAYRQAPVTKRSTGQPSSHHGLQGRHQGRLAHPAQGARSPGARGSLPGRYQILPARTGLCASSSPKRSLKSSSSVHNIQNQT